jgi:mRNA interferase HigB
MRVISRRRLQDFSGKYPQAKKNLEAWYYVVKNATWASLAEVRQVYPTADAVEGLTVFNISGNNYRLITHILYKQQIVYLRDVLTHAEYTKGRWKP